MTRLQSDILQYTLVEGLLIKPLRNNEKVLLPSRVSLSSICELSEYGQLSPLTDIGNQFKNG